ncbi:hypothetical protein LTR62_005439 [Meristemomyces frigidus]|uniref:NAD(P)-binding protein n=1 Tax=Meristemomyces frigidus TaxID=1508187 RepID=A0AAN7TDH5_9PEZI|nr:hypothetical protein LTR62_005439 [Meristemomyces frigidus]
MSRPPHTHKVALITGACGGLGRSIAENFLLEGANVVVCDINDKLIADFKEKVSSAYPECTLVLKADVTDDAALDDIFEQAEKRFGGVDFVVNNAGVMDRFDPAGSMERSLWDRVIAINLTAPAMVTQRAVNMMLKHGTKGSIVNISSVAGVRGFANGAAYTASKHGLLGLTKNTGAFYKSKGIRCNAIMAGELALPLLKNMSRKVLTSGVLPCAGGMQTNVANQYLTDQGPNFNMEGYGVHSQAFPMEHLVMVETEKIAKFVSYLCSDAANIINGATLTADGGWTAN